MCPVSRGHTRVQMCQVVIQVIPTVGTHAIEMEYYARVSVQGTNFHPVYKNMARLMAIGRSNIFFNTAVIQKKETVMALSLDRKKAFVLLDNAQWVTKEVPQLPGELKINELWRCHFRFKKSICNGSVSKFWIR